MIFKFGTTMMISSKVRILDISNFEVIYRVTICYKNFSMNNIGICMIFFNAFLQGITYNFY